MQPHLMPFAGHIGFWLLVIFLILFGVNMVKNLNSGLLIPIVAIAAGVCMALGI